MLKAYLSEVRPDRYTVGITGRTDRGFLVNNPNLFAVAAPNGWPRREALKKLKAVRADLARTEGRGLALA